MNKERCLGVLVLLASIVISFVFYSHLDTSVVGTDDANIFFVYARNLANGNGLVYNEGGERVEGFSSLLWVLVNTVGYFFTDNPEIIFLAINIVFFIFLIHCGIKFIENEILPVEQSVKKGLSWQSLFFVAGLLSSPGFFFWTTLSLMESGLWTLLLLLSVCEVFPGIGSDRVDRKIKNNRFRILLFSLILTRPEGLAWALFFCFVYVFNRYPLLTNEKRDAWLSFFTILTTATGLLIFRLLYFGEPLPNTYYAKVSPNILYNIRAGAKYFEGFLRDNFLVAPLFMSCVVLIFLMLKKTKTNKDVFFLDVMYKRRILTFSFLILLGVMIPVFTGGDCFGLYRFYQPIWPIFLLTAIQIVSRVLLLHGGKTGRRYHGSAKYLVLLIIFLSFGLSMELKWNRIFRSQPVTQIELARDGRAIGKRLKELFVDIQPMVGVYCAGGIKYGYNGPVFDLLGLNHHDMAHTPGERDGLKNHAAFNNVIFYKSPPHLLIPRLDKRPDLYLKRMSTFYYPLKGLEKEERFLSLFSLAAIRWKGEKKDFICAYYKKDYLKTLVESGKYEYLVF